MAADLYATDTPIHLTICAADGQPFADRELATQTCTALERTCASLEYRLYAYCLMPDHMHALVSPADSETPVATLLRRFKSFTTRAFQKRSGLPRLWQLSARDRLARPAEDPVVLATYIANNPVRRGLVQVWTDWPYTRVYVE